MSSNWPMVLLVGVMVLAGGTGRASEMAAGPAKVEIRQTGGYWSLYVNQKPFFIKGAGLEFGSQEALAAAGGNSFRTWRVDNGRENGQQILDRAQKNGLFVTMGLELSPERKGFDYSNAELVARQFAQIKAQVLQLKNHPALLMWDLGNELNLNARDPKVWDAVNELSKMIHQVDPNHPTTTSLAGISKELVDQIKVRAADLDLLSVQSYADIVNLQRELPASGWKGPYVVTEWGATGHWECGRTAWDAPLEDDSSVKAELYGRRYQFAIATDTNRCLGSYVFLWGQKQERTPTWYGMFLASGEATESVDVMQHIWTGDWPASRSPQVKGFWLDGKIARQNIRLQAGQHYPAKVLLQAPTNAPLSCNWEIMEESAANSAGGDFESAPPRLAGLVASAGAAEAEITAPANQGAYRLFVYARDANHKAAYANIPFYVDAKSAKVTPH